MNEPVVLASFPSTQNEAMLSSILPDSPHSVDSGMADSPDNSMPDSPTFFEGEDSPEQLSYMFQNPNVVKPVAQNPQIDSFLSAAPPMETQTSFSSPNRLTDEKSIQTLLEFLVSNKSTSESVLKVLGGILGNSLKKDDSLKSQLHPAATPTPKSLGRKRPRTQENNMIVAKELRLDGSRHAQVKPSIVVTEQPEQNYRARYESEGCRGPVHGSSDMTFPTIKIEGYTGSLWVTVYLATNKGLPHFHLLCGPGSTRIPCRNIMLPGDIPAIQVLVGPETGMTAVLDCISLKRRRNFEADKELKRRGYNPADWKLERKEACFVFKAEIPGSQVITCQSQVFQCTVPPGNPEIWWMKPDKCSALGGEEVGLIGKKFPKGFKVRFFGNLPTGENWEAYGEVDRTKCNQGAGVVKAPRLEHPIISPLQVNVEICTGKGSNHVSSDSFEFTYLPTEKPANGDEIPPAYDIFPENLGVVDLIDAMAHFVREPMNQPPTQNVDKKAKDWEDLSLILNVLRQKGDISTEQLKEIQTLVSLEDAILLQAYRSTKKSFSDSEFLNVFRHYLSGLTAAQ